MESNYRQGYDILADMLKWVKENGANTKTRLMYATYLSHDQIEKYLSYAEKQTLVEKREEDKKATYMITEKGQEYLSAYANLKLIVP